MKKAHIADIKKELRSYASAQKAKELSWFFKTGPGEYGEGDKFIGVQVPCIRKLAKKYYQDIGLADISSLLRSGIHEERLTALICLLLKYEKADAAGKQRIFDLYVSKRKFINNWDLVDLTAPRIAGAHLFKGDRGLIYRLAGSRTLWDRRIAVLATFYFIRENDFSDALKLAKMFLNDKEDLMHKATGWMLREIGKRDVEALRGFLRKHSNRMPRTMLRYAIEKFGESERLKWLKG